MSLNDPQWGKRGGGGNNAGPPDLDEIWRNVNRRAQRPVRPQGRRRRRSRPRRRRRPPAPRCRCGGAGLLVAPRAARSGSRAASTSSTKAAAASSRASASTPRRRSPGRAGTCRSRSRAASSSTSRRCKTIEIGYRNNVEEQGASKEALMLTDDENIVDIQFAVQYNLKSAEDYLFNNRRPDQMRRLQSARDRDARGRGQEQDGLRALRGPRADRQADARS